MNNVDDLTLAVNEIASELHEKLLESSLSVSKTEAMTSVVDGRFNLSFMAEIESRQVILNVGMMPKSFERACTLKETRSDLLKTAVDSMRFLAAKSFYEGNYRVISEHYFKTGPRVTLKGNSPNTCRFCAQSSPLVAFKKRAHALPESVGNKQVFSKYECDNCNASFGRGIEDQFGVWSNWQRTIFQVEGKGGIPSLSMKNGHIKVLTDLTEIKLPDDSMARFNDDKTVLDLDVPSPPFIPAAVLKAFNKMALSLMKDEDISEFHDVLDWINDANHEVTRGQFSKVLSTYLPNHDFSGGHVVLFRRTNDDLSKPYTILVLSFGNVCYQLILPSPKGKQNFAVTVTPYFFLYLEGKGVEEIGSNWIELHGCEKIQEMRTVTFRIFKLTKSGS